MLERSRARDAAYDGRFLTGVLSTGIYCLPSCKARSPNAENVVFVATAEEARSLGLRPCLRCRPDDFLAGRDPGHELVVNLLARLRREPATIGDVTALAKAAGCGVTRLHSLCREHLHLSPAELLQRERVAAARERLLAGDERVADVAFAVGFESLSTFNDNVRRATGLVPSELRQLRSRSNFTLTLPSDLRVDDMLRILARDPASRSERRVGDTLWRAVTLDGVPSVIEIALAAGESSDRTTAVLAHCRVYDGGGPPSPAAMTEAQAIVLRLFGLPVDTAAFETRLCQRPRSGRRAADGPEVPRLAVMVARRPGLRVPRMADVFETVCWAILGQQVNLTFALKLRRTLVELAGKPVPGCDLIAPPSPAAVAALDPADLVARQLSRRKAEVLIDLARAVADGTLDLEALASGTATAADKALREIRGLGPWSAGYISMRGLGFVDAVPVGDSALATALGRLLDRDPRPRGEELRELLAPFAPYRSLATMHLWLSLGDSP